MGAAVRIVGKLNHDLEQFHSCTVRFLARLSFRLFHLSQFIAEIEGLFSEVVLQVGLSLIFLFFSPLLPFFLFLLGWGATGAFRSARQSDNGRDENDGRHERDPEIGQDLEEHGGKFSENKTTTGRQAVARRL